VITLVSFINFKRARAENTHYTLLTEEGTSVGNWFVGEVTVLGDPAPPAAQKQFVGKPRELIGVGLFDPSEVLVADRRTPLQFHRRRQHQDDVAREGEALVVLRLSPDPLLGKMTLLRET